MRTSSQHHCYHHTKKHSHTRPTHPPWFFLHSAPHGSARLDWWREPFSTIHWPVSCRKAARQHHLSPLHPPKRQRTKIHHHALCWSCHVWDHRLPGEEQGQPSPGCNALAKGLRQCSREAVLLCFCFKDRWDCWPSGAQAICHSSLPKEGTRG